MTEEQASSKACDLLRKIYISETHPNMSAYDDDYIIRNYPDEWSWFMQGWVEKNSQEIQKSELIDHKIKEFMEMLDYSYKYKTTNERNVIEQKIRDIAEIASSSTPKDFGDGIDNAKYVEKAKKTGKLLWDKLD